MARKTQRDWLEAGWHLLAEQGIAALTIERLTERLGITKGSFYHHFAGLPDYRTALLAFLEQEETLQVIQVTEQAATPAAKLRRLLDLVVRYPPDSEIALRAWALQDEEARGVQARIDARRVEYLHTLCAPLAPTEAQALRMARLAYVILIGSGHLQPPLSSEALRELFDEFLALYHVP